MSSCAARPGTSGLQHHPVALHPIIAVVRPEGGDDRGNGMVLAIWKRIVKRDGGRIWVKS